MQTQNVIFVPGRFAPGDARDRAAEEAGERARAGAAQLRRGFREEAAAHARAERAQPARRRRRGAHASAELDDLDGGMPLKKRALAAAAHASADGVARTRARGGVHLGGRQAVRMRLTSSLPYSQGPLRTA